MIAAEGEQNAARALKEASDIMSESSSALQLRYLQTLNTISAEKNSTIIFPLPIDMISSFTKWHKQHSASNQTQHPTVSWNNNDSNFLPVTIGINFQNENHTRLKSSSRQYLL